MTTLTQEEQFKLKLDILGYTKDLKPFDSIRGLEQVEKNIRALVLPPRFDLPVISLEEVKTGAQAFYNKYFSLHNIPLLSNAKLEENISKLHTLSDGIAVAQSYNSLASLINPFELPIQLIEGHSMEGFANKTLLLTSHPGFKENIKIPFSHIELGDNLTVLSTPTYIHEISHTQTESIPGYTESYCNKEVISIFLEKLAALEQDSTGNLLRISERARFAYCSELIRYLKATEFLKRMNKYSNEDSLDATMYIISTLYATKLFDIYQKARKPKEKTRILSGIQSVFDGNQTVEDLLAKEGITIAQSKDINLIKRHI